MNIFLEQNTVIFDIEVGIVDPIDIYISLHSYIKNPEISLWRVELKSKNSQVIRNIKSITRLKYVEFKLWWYDIENREGSGFDSHYDSVVDGNTTIIIKLHNSNNKYPIYPWSEKIIKNLFYY